MTDSDLILFYPSLLLAYRNGAHAAQESWAMTPGGIVRKTVSSWYSGGSCLASPSRPYITHLVHYCSNLERGVSSAKDAGKTSDFLVDGVNVGTEVP